MAKEYFVVELSEQDIKELIIEKYNLEINGTELMVNHFDGDRNENGYTRITVKGQKKNPNILSDNLWVNK